MAGVASVRARARDRVNALVEVRVRRAEQGAEGHHGDGDGSERRRGEPRERLFAVGREAELLEGNRGR